MTDDELAKLQESIGHLTKLVSPRARVLILAELIDQQIAKFGGFCDETEIAAAVKSVLVVRAGGFSEPQKAATESLMSRGSLHLGLKKARELEVEK